MEAQEAEVIEQPVQEGEQAQAEDLMLVPEQGFSPGDFPSLAVALIAYNANPSIRPDPMMTINDEGWLFIETGNVRIAIPDREEWTKLVLIGERLWNSHELTLSNQRELLTQQLLAARKSPGAATMGDGGGNTLKENTNGSTDHPDERGPGQPPGDDCTDPRGDGAAPPSVQA